MKSSITTHILDTSKGRPAVGVSVRLQRKQLDGTWQELSRGTTNEDGRITDLLPLESTLQGSDFRLVFETGEYFRRAGVEAFYPFVTVEFSTKDENHYHVPLLLSPYGYTTYRGS
ncbi:MAG: hydroxyisourate hydrolase [Ignavibacteria bacterium]